MAKPHSTLAKAIFRSDELLIGSDSCISAAIVNREPASHLPNTYVFNWAWSVAYGTDFSHNLVDVGPKSRILP